ncbi:AMP-binding protein [Streptomyces sp. NPDC051172]|uniref:AMP-binding protein n=1 Tax=Streptomyces sp. NPDC051172 TaxID=3155796 RepID=UPI0034446057
MTEQTAQRTARRTAPEPDGPTAAVPSGAGDVGGAGTLDAAFAAWARRQPEACALVWHERRVGYGELLDAADAQRDRVARLPLRPGEPVGVHAAKSPEAVALVLGCLAAGRPVVLPPATLPEATLRVLFAAVGCRFVLGPDEVATIEPAPAPGPTPPPGTGFVLTTSGSTGTPKTVPLTADAVRRFTAWAGDRFGIRPGLTVLNHAPLNFDLCLLDVWTTLAHGGTVLLCDPAHAANGRYLAELIRSEPVHLVQAVPIVHRLLIEAAGDRPLAGVRHVVVTGDTLPRRDVLRLPDLFPGARLYNVYGCTETNDSFLYEIDPARLPEGPLPLGDPLPGVGTLVRTDDGTELAGPGRGELYVSTPFQSPGYLTASEGAAARFGPHPLDPADGRRWYRTGDLVERGTDGHLRLRGRDDFQVKVRGTRVDPQDVERVLLEHPDAAEAAVLAVPDEPGGHALLAVVRRTPGSDLNSLVLRGHCARRLVPAAIPATLRVTDAPLPRTSTGKVDRTALNRA